MIEIKENYSQSIKDLFKRYHYQASVASALQGKLKGKIFVDDLCKPRSSLMVNSEGLFIAGSPENPYFIKQLSNYMEDTIQQGAPIRDTDDLWFYIDNPNWEKHFPEIFTSRTPFKVRRLHFTIRLPARDWTSRLLEGYEIHRADTSLEYASLSFPDDVWDWVKGSLDDYLYCGFGALLTHKDRVVSWCTTDCATVDRCELGIITTAIMRLKGFGS